ncbi:MAG: hypothetical protein M3540_03490 [Actinomycetota bacterium]|nr:hypothetical protein [Actinomycetota bacterium]
MSISRPEAPPTTRQIYSLAGALCERMGEEFPKTRSDASETIERLRIENGHPSPKLEDSPRALRRRRDGKPKSEKTLAFARLARELRDE